MSTTTAVTKYQPKEIVATRAKLRDLVTSDAMRDAVKSVAPSHCDPSRLLRMAITAASRNTRLLECTQESILKALIEAGTLGLDCSGLLGRGYLVPYKNRMLSAKAKATVYEAQFQAGYLGLCDLARRDPSVVTLYPKAVYSSDEFEYEEGLEPRLVHKPDLSSEANQCKETLRLVYAVCVFTEGFRQAQVMTIAEVERHRQRSRAANEGPWATDYIAMAMKTVVRQLCKFIPQTPEMVRAATLDEVEWKAPDETEQTVLDHLDQAEEIYGEAEQQSPDAEPVDNGG